MSISNDNTIIKIGQVESIDDEYAAGRIRARVVGDRYNNETPYAYPLLPYMMHIKPKVGEAVLLIYSNLGNSSQRFYIGPIIHQPQFVNKDNFSDAISFLKGYNDRTLVSVDRIPEAQGVYPKKDEIAIMGRKDSDLIFSDNDVRLRCGVRKTNKYNNLESEFNRLTPSFIKLKQHDTNFSNNTCTTATIVSENINLISTVGTPEFNVSDVNESISDEEMAKIIETAHQLPYGDKLVDFLKLLLKAFNAHTHNYHNLPPIPDMTYNAVNNFNLNDILSKNVKIN
jgi:hypothetical protein